MNIIKNRTHRNVKFLGTHILHYNHHGRKVYQYIEGITNNNSISVGFPRSDKLFNFTPRVDDTDLNQVTLFYTAAANKNRLLPSEMWGRLDIIKKLDDFYEMIINVAHKFKEMTFKIKFKRKMEHYNLFLDMVEKRNLSVPDNIEFIFGGDPIDLLIKSSAIFGFNSTVLLEALILKKPIIEPLIIKDQVDLSFSFFGEFSGVSNYVDSEEQIYSILNFPEKYMVNEQNRIRALRHYFAYTDGKSSNRVNSLIKNITESNGFIKKGFVA